jgi:hypothetical protein
MTEVHGLSAGNTIAYEQNSLAAEAGKICSRTGNFEGHNSERAAQRPHPGRPDDLQLELGRRLRGTVSFLAGATTLLMLSE